MKYSKLLAPQPREACVRKHVYSSFYDTRLASLLRNRGVKTLFLGRIPAGLHRHHAAADGPTRPVAVHVTLTQLRHDARTGTGPGPPSLMLYPLASYGDAGSWQRAIRCPSSGPCQCHWSQWSHHTAHSSRPRPSVTRWALRVGQVGSW